MEKEQFLDVDTKRWWLLERDLDQTLDDRRKSLGEACGYTDLLWYNERLKLEELYQFLELNHSDLLRELDEATDVEKRQRWLDAVIEVKRPPAAKAGQEAPAAEKPAEAAAPRAAAPAAAPPKKASAFGRAKPAEEAGTAAETPAAQTPAGAAAAPAAAAESAKKSIFKKKAAEPAAAAAAAPQPTMEELKETLSGLAADPDIPISEEDFQKAVQDPEFGAKLAAAEAELQAELEAELEAELAAEREQ